MPDQKRAAQERIDLANFLLDDAKDKLLAVKLMPDDVNSWEGARFLIRYAQAAAVIAGTFYLRAILEKLDAPNETTEQNNYPAGTGQSPGPTTYPK